MKKIFRGSGFKLDSHLLKELDGTDEQIWRERLFSAKAQGLAFDNPRDLHCKKHPTQKLSVVSKESNPYHNWTYYFCGDCTLEDLLGSHNNSVEYLRGGTAQGFWKSEYLNAKGRLERYINAIEQGKFVVETVEDSVDMSMKGYYCPNCNVVVKDSWPNVYHPGRRDSVILCGVCERGLRDL